MFSHSIKTNGKVSVELRSQLDLTASKEDFENLTEQTKEIYSLRRG